MKLSLFLNPVDENLSEMKAEDNSVVGNLSFYGANMDELSDYDLAIIGVNEKRGMRNENVSNFQCCFKLFVNLRYGFHSFQAMTSKIKKIINCFL